MRATDAARGLDDLLQPQHYAYDALATDPIVAAVLVALAGFFILAWERGSRISRLFLAYALLLSLWIASRA